jgi:hypothetical protein
MKHGELPISCSKKIQNERILACEITSNAYFICLTNVFMSSMYAQATYQTFKDLTGKNLKKCNLLMTSTRGNEKQQDSFPELVPREAVNSHVSKISP